MFTEDLPFVAMILAGGLGTRLRSLVSDRPKPMAPVGDVPFVRILIDSLAKKRVRDFVILTGYMADAIESYFRETGNQSQLIRFSRESAPMGTGGAVSNAAAYATDPTLLVNGDTFFDGDIRELYAFHCRNNAHVTLSLTRVEDAGRYGSVTLDKHGRVVGFAEKEVGSSDAGLINAGVSLLSREFILGLPRGRCFSMERDVFPLLAGQGTMFGLQQNAPFFDIGAPESFLAFQEFARCRGLSIASN
jgi:D-glycero-alpha-D-manno-heptose 1-phosphate guanylyltransferase